MKRGKGAKPNMSFAMLSKSIFALKKKKTMLLIQWLLSQPDIVSEAGQRYKQIQGFVQN